MDIEKFTKEETARLENFLAAIISSLNMNPFDDERKKSDILKFTTRIYNDEIDFLERNPEDYYELYHETPDEDSEKNINTQP